MMMAATPTIIVVVMLLLIESKPIADDGEGDAAGALTTVACVSDQLLP